MALTLKGSQTVELLLFWSMISRQMEPDKEVPTPEQVKANKEKWNYDG